VLGVPGSPGASGWALLALGAFVAVAALIFLNRRLRREPPATAAGLICLVATVCAVPYVVWRIQEDLRLTTTLHGYSAEAAGPIQAYLPGYLVDGARRLIPRDATYATAVSSAVPWAPARAAFPSLALITLFPRRSVADPRQADYIVSWGIPPAQVAPVTRVWVAQARAGAYLAVYVARVRR